MGLSKALYGASSGLTQGMNLVDFMNRLKELEYTKGKRAEEDEHKKELENYLSSQRTARETLKGAPDESLDMVKIAPDWHAPMALKEQPSQMGPNQEQSPAKPEASSLWTKGIEMPQGPMSVAPGLNKSLSDPQFLSQLAQGLDSLRMQQNPEIAPEVLKNQIAVKRKQDALLALDTEVDGIIQAKGYAPSSNDYRKLMTVKADIDNEDFDTASKRLFEFRDERDLLSDEERKLKNEMRLKALDAANKKDAYGERTFALKPGQIDNLNNFDTAMNQINTVKATFKPQFVGPVAGRFGGAKETLGILGQDEAVFRSALQEFKNILLKLRSGAAVTPSEYERLNKEVSNPNATPEQFNAIVNRAVMSLQNQKNTYLGSLKKSKYDVGEWGNDIGQIDLSGGLNSQGQGGQSNSVKSASGKVYNLD